MKKTELSKYILNHFKTHLKEYNFKYYSNKYRGKGFEKQTDFGSIEISFSFIDYAPIFYCMPYVSIRFDEVQHIYNQINPMADWAKPFSKTISIDLTRLDSNSNLLTDKGYKIESENEILKTVDEIENQMMDIIFAWFSSLDKLEKINEKINSNLLKSIDLFISDDERIFKGLITSKLNNDSNYLENENTYRKKCDENLGGKETIKFKKLIDILHKA